MKKLISICIAVFLGINIVTSCSIVTADSIEAKYTYTIQDVQNLQNYLLTKPTKDNLAEKPYDLNDDDVWDVFDLCLMKRELLNQQKKTKMNIEVNGYTLTATLADNVSAQAFFDLLKDEPIVLELSEYGSFEKVGTLPQRLPKDDERITTEPGDIMLYQGNQITIFYGSNTWAYTRLGRINNVTQAELKEILGTGNVTITATPHS